MPLSALNIAQGLAYFQSAAAVRATDRRRARFCLRGGLEGRAGLKDWAMWPGVLFTAAGMPGLLPTVGCPTVGCPEASLILQAERHNLQL